eukprot:7387660-Heterocapsa_arctica.AAC.1
MPRRAAPLTGETSGVPDNYVRASALAVLAAQRSYVREAPTQAAALAAMLAAEPGAPDGAASSEFWRRISTH